MPGREEWDDMERVKLDNKRVLFNLPPAYVTQHFLMSSPQSTVLYCQSCSQVEVTLTSIPKFNDFYIQLDDSNMGVQCLRPLNETIADLGEAARRPEHPPRRGPQYRSAPGLPDELLCGQAGYVYALLYVKSGDGSQHPA
ncbi:adenylate cyclase type 1-like [Vicugna pacos]|uniref:Adenylate cyclase type 1-like n=1 Tax=Vicugna pacos TaxID=30538 RepID=A0ABM5CKE4_VICPA